jgi:hypothetical protein
MRIVERKHRRFERGQNRQQGDVGHARSLPVLTLSRQSGSASDTKVN